MSCGSRGNTRRWFFTGVIALAMGQVPAVAQTPQQVFDSLYGTEIRKAKVSREFDDDLALASRLELSASDKATDPQLAGLMLNEAFGLASGSVEGIELAQRLAGRLAELEPGRAVELDAAVLSLLERHYNRASGEQRVQIAGELVDRYIAIGDQQFEQDQSAEALASYRTARRYARHAGEAQIQACDLRLDRAGHQLAVLRQVENLQQRLSRDPTDSAAGAALVDLLLIELNSPTKAAASLKLIADPAMSEWIRQASAAPADLTAEQLISMADWYRAKADAASAHAKGGALQHAIDYYQAYLDRQTPDTLARSKAQISIDQIRLQIVGASDGWKNGLAKLDPEKDMQGKWDRAGARWTGQGEPALLRIPIELEGSYQVKMKVARTGGAELVGFALPVGSARVLAVFDSTGNQTGLSMIDRKYIGDTGVAVRTPAMGTGRFYELKASVEHKGETVVISLFFDGGAVFKWTGKAGQLSLSSRFRMAGDDKNAIVVGWNVAVEEVMVKRP